MNDIDKDEIIRQQAEYILDLEERLLGYETKWKFVQQELQEMQLERELRKEIND